MKGDKAQAKTAAAALGKKMNLEELNDLFASTKQEGHPLSVGDFLGLTDGIVESIYGQAYRLYNTGKYEEAIEVFRLLLMVRASEPKFALGAAACFHRLKQYKSAIDSYIVMTMIDPETPIPFFHMSDCYIQMGDAISSLTMLQLAIEKAGDKAEFHVLKDRATLTLQGLNKIMERKKDS